MECNFYKSANAIKYFILLYLLLVSCSSDNKERIEIDFSVSDTNIVENTINQQKSYRAAIAAMTSPKETFVNYQKLIDYISEKLNIKIELVQRKTYQEVNNMIADGHLEFAFICSGAYVQLRDKCDVEILAVPQYGGKCLYQAYIITNKNSDIKKFEDLYGRSFAYTDPLSNTGRLYALIRLKDFDTNEKDFFSNVIYSNAHDNSIYLVNRGLVDAATIDGLIYDYFEVNDPEKIENLQIIEKSEYFGIPPIVIRSDKREELAPVKNVLLNMHKDETGRRILSELLFEKFVPGYDSSYNSIRNNYEYIKR